ncbi:MAG: hypothetical protein E6J14_02860 [Chloroflexi bacterium]|nr:MAG: hypothetical protein E6J14_02860 [Chloroflexota bacterium]
MYETVLAHAVRRRGSEPVFATCGGRLPICDIVPGEAAPPMPCHSCRQYATGALTAGGFEALELRDVVDVGVETALARKRIAQISTVAQCEAFEHDGLAIGRLVRVSTAWFLSRGSLPEEPLVRRTYRRFLVSGMVVAAAFRRLLEQVRPRRVFLLNGSFFAERILRAIAEGAGIPVVTYEKGFLLDTLLVTEGAAACDLEVGDAAWRSAATISLSEEENRMLDEYLDERTRGGRTFDSFWVENRDDIATIRAELALEPGRRLAVLFSNILWDSAVQDKEVTFASMPEWVIEAVRWVSQRPDVDLVLRLHPAEVKLANHPTRERMSDVLSAAFAAMPANVRIIQPESTISSYRLMEIADVGLVYTSTVGLEMACLGHPVVTAGAVHYRGRGFTIDPGDAQTWRAAIDLVLDDPPDPTDRAATRDLARRYANLFFFQFHQAWSLIHEEGRSRPRLLATDAASIAPGADPVLDRIAGHVLSGRGPLVTPRSRAER